MYALKTMADTLDHWYVSCTCDVYKIQIEQLWDGIFIEKLINLIQVNK